MSWFGGFFGGSAVSLSDILGNHQLVFAGYVNGRISEAQVLAAYANMSHRINWATGISQEPYYFYEPSEIRVGTPTPSENTFVTNVRRLVVRSAFGQAYYPISRFQRIEASMRVANVDDAVLSILEPYDPEWIEEPVPPENAAALARVRAATRIPIATGERAHTIADIREFAKEDPLFWTPSPLLVDLVARGANFDSLNKS